jgi:hypothetical protein
MHTLNNIGQEVRRAAMQTNNENKKKLFSDKRRQERK